MKKTFLLSMVLMSLLYSISSFAGLLIEPLVGINWISSYDIDHGKNYSPGLGYGYGGRVGFQKAGFQLGGDFMRSSSDMTNGNFKRNVSTSENGVFVGYKFPVLFKVYAEYIFSANGDTKINDKKVNLKEGNGGKIGVGFTLLPFLDLNLDYRRITFKDEKIGSFMASVSLPFDLF